LLFRAKHLLPHASLEKSESLKPPKRGREAALVIGGQGMLWQSKVK
jgi:hypothetical protein